jgi:hypothetical protein
MAAWASIAFFVFLSSLPHVCAVLRIRYLVAIAAKYPIGARSNFVKRGSLATGLVPLAAFIAAWLFAFKYLKQHRGVVLLVTLVATLVPILYLKRKIPLIRALGYGPKAQK